MSPSNVQANPGLSESSPPPCGREETVVSQLQTSDSQRRLAGQVAWERGLKITNWPRTSGALSGLIAAIKRDHEPLAAAEWQIERFQRLVNDCAERVEDFDAAAYSELPASRTDANIAIDRMEKALNSADFTATVKSATSDFVTVEETAPNAAPVGDADEAPF